MSYRFQHRNEPGVEMSLDAARMSACATQRFGGLKPDSQRKLQLTWISYRGRRAKTGRGRCGIQSVAKDVVWQLFVCPVQDIEGFGQRFQPEAFRERETAA